MVPVITFVSGRCVAKIMCIPTARAFAAIREIGNSISLPDVASDDIRVSDPDLQAAIPETQKYILVYTWADEIYSESENDDEIEDL